ncbi:hypothetical protein OG285_00060 [Streptomyces sp. NBC_01471]|uniref:RNase A-like domain-containing protein n=1 Tax=Streptomyces sp. NBC_01471 TaxID=2903879 RepID=UPI003246AA98
MPPRSAGQNEAPSAAGARIRFHGACLRGLRHRCTNTSRRCAPSGPTWNECRPPTVRSKTSCGASPGRLDPSIGSEHRRTTSHPGRNGADGDRAPRHHVVLTDKPMADDAIGKGIATRWNDEATAAQSVDEAIQAWIKTPKNAKRLESWKIKQSHNKSSDPRKDLLLVEWTLRDKGSLGRRWVKGGAQGEATGNKVVIQFRYAGKHKPTKFVVYTSYPE